MRRNLSWLALYVLVETLYPITASADTPLDSGGIVIPATWVYAAGVRDDTLYFATESTSTTGSVYKINTDSTASRLARFGKPCISLGSVQDTLFVGLKSIGKVLRSDDGGTSWDTTGEFGGVANVYALKQCSSGVFFAATGDNNGDVFHALWNSLVGGGVLAGPAWAYGLTDRLGALFASTNCDTAEVWRSGDSGVTWAPVNRNFPGTLGYDVFRDADTLYIGLNNSRGVWRSTNGGTSWDSCPSPPGASDAYCFRRQTGRPFLVCTGMTNGDIFRACYNSQLGGGVLAGPAWAYGVTDRLDTLFAATNCDTAEVWLSADSGVTWAPVNRNFPGTLGYDVFRDADTLYVGLNNSRGVWRSTNGGTTWDSTPSLGGASDAYRFSRQRGRPFLVSTGSTNGDIFRACYSMLTGGSELAGASWVHGVGPQGDWLWAGAGTDTARMWRWAPWPDTWYQTAAPPADNVLSVEPVGQNIYAGTDDSGRVYVSYDTGATWTATGALSGSTRAYSLKLSRWVRPAKLIAATGDANGDAFVSDSAVAPDVGVAELLAPIGIVPYDTVITPSAVVANYGFGTATFLTVMYIGPDYSETLHVSLDHGEVDTLEFPGWHAAPAGSHVVKCSTMYTDDYVQANDLRGSVVAADSGDGPIILSVTPSRVGTAGYATLVIVGRRFQQGARVRLTRAGSSEVISETLGTLVLDTCTARALFRLADEPAGLWSIVLSNPDGRSCRLFDGLELEPGHSDLWVDVVGPSPIRAGRSTAFTIHYGNHGNNDVGLARCLVWAPARASIKIDLPDSILGADALPAPHGAGLKLASAVIEEPQNARLITESLVVAQAQLGQLRAGSSSSMRVVVTAPPGAGIIQLATAIESCSGRHLPIADRYAVRQSVKLDAAPTVSHKTRTSNTLVSDDPILIPPGDPEWRAGYNARFIVPGPDGRLWYQDGLALANGYVGIADPWLGEDCVKAYRLSTLLERETKGIHWKYLGLFRPGPHYSAEYALQAVLRFRELQDQHLTFRETGENGVSCIEAYLFCAPELEGLASRDMARTREHGHDLWTNTSVHEYISELNSTEHRLALGLTKLAGSFPLGVINLFVRVTWAVDPNSKAAPAGSDSVKHYVPPARRIWYDVCFENVDTATAPAETVVVTDRLDNNLDWSSLTLDTVSHHDVCTIQLDSASRTITWHFDSIMLPPNDSPPEGEGFCRFSILPRQDLPTGIEIRNFADIVFDQNPPMRTDTVSNTIDAFAPVSSVRAMPETTQTGEFTVRWTGADDLRGSGIRSYDIHVKKDSGEFVSWLVETSDTSAIFTAANESRYWFYCMATDNVGWRESEPPSPDAHTFVNGVAPPAMVSPYDTSFANDTTPSFTWTATAGAQGTYVLQYSRDSQFVANVESVPGLADTTYTVSDSSALFDTTWFWRVKAVSRLGTPSTYRAVWQFTVDTQAPGTPSLLSPPDSSTTYDSTPTFRWSTVTEPKCWYSLLGALDTGFDDVRVGVFTDESTYAVREAHPLNDTGYYYWRVKAVDRAGNGSSYQTHPFRFSVMDLRDISGNALYYASAHPAIGSASLVLSGARLDTTQTDTAGFYEYLALLAGRDYTVTPEKRSASREPVVTAFDASYVLQHVVHDDTLDSLQSIAGDVSGDGTVSAYDAALILRYAVGMIHHFPVGYRPALDTVDWEFWPRQRVYDSLSSHYLDQDYAGILYGDPSGNWPGSDVLAAWEGATLGSRSACFTLNMPSAEKRSSGPVAQWTSEDQSQATPSDAPATGSGQTLNAAMSGSAIAPDVLRVTRGTRMAVSEGPLAASRQPSANDLVFPLKAHGARDMVSADALVRHDVKRFKLNAIRTTPATEGFMVAAADRDGLVRISMAGATKLNGDVPLLDLVFGPAGGQASMGIGERDAQSSVQEVHLPVTLSERSESKGLRATAASGEASRFFAGAQNDTASGSVGRELLAVSGEPLALTSEPSAVSGRPPAEVVWLVLNEGAAGQTGPAGEGAMGEEKKLPTTFYLAPPKPNPFGDGTSISYGLPFASEVRLSVFDVAGKKVRTLVDGTQPAGRYSLVWDGSDNRGRRLANGVYFIRMKTPTFRFQHKVTLLR